MINPAASSLLVKDKSVEQKSSMDVSGKPGILTYDVRLPLLLESEPLEQAIGFVVE
jgi:hypothetical protein